ncbi:MAG: FtsH protease activity modulator HflK [Spirochaetaceae bacterium]|nr:MAG: FtsH protease activity modulator HflK [Spirochaetaceae bacterium]
MSERDVSPGRTPRRLTPRAIIIVVLVILLLITVFSSFFVVDPQETAAVLRFGRFIRMAEPGLHFKLPFGIEKNYNVPTQVVLKDEFGFRTERPGITTIRAAQDFPGESIMLTGDLNIVDVEWIIQYRIVDAFNWLFKVQEKEKTIRDISQSVINQLVGDRAIFDVIGAERANIETQGQDHMNRLFDKYELGIRVTTVKLQNIVPPAGPVQEAFEDVNKAIQDRSRLINEGQEAYNQAIPRAKGQAEQLVQEAEGYAVERVNKAEGDVARFSRVLTEYNRSPGVTRTRLYYEMFEEVFKDAENVDLIDKNLQNFIPFKALESSSAGGAQ